MKTDYKELMIYIAKNVEMSSRFLSPIRTASIEAVGLLDKIAELRGISSEQNGIEFNQICDELEEKTNN